MDSINLKLQADGSVFIIEDNQSVIKEKQIDPDSLISLIERSTYAEITDSFGSILPKNCIYHGFRERRSGELIEVAMIEREKCIRPYNHFGQIETVGYPKLIFAYKIINKRIAASSLVAAKDEFITEKSPVYHFPYANVFMTNGICTGNYHYPEIETLDGLNYLPEDFYFIEHTHERNATDEVIRDILDQVQDKPFDDNLLKFCKTFKQFVEDF